QPLLINFRETVNSFSTDRRIFRSRNALCGGAADWAMHVPIALAQLFYRTHRWKYQSMFRTIAGAFAVNSLRAGNNNFLNRQGFLADYFKHLGSAERIHMHKFCDLGHVTPVGCLVKNHVDLVERGGNRIAITQITLNEFRFLVDPGRLSPPVSLWFQIIERPNL